VSKANLSRREFLERGVYMGAALPAAMSSQPKGNAPRQARPKPNIVYVLTDQWRAQATGYAGDPNVMTPHLDALASESIHFENAVSVCPVCTPHRASLLTGRYPLSTGMFLNDLYLPKEELCIAEIFEEAGYETGYIGKWHLDGHGRDTFIPRDRRQGFEYWKVLECTHQYNESYYYAGDDPTLRRWEGYDAYAETKDAQGYILEHAKGEKPFLLFVAYGGPHFPHHIAPEELKERYPPPSIQLPPNVPDEMKERAQREAQGYYAHCTALDFCVGDLWKTLKETGVAEDTVLVFTSDHGEMLGSQGQAPCEKQRPWDESVRVPFLLRYPAAMGDQGRIVRTPINTPDILPTLLSLAGIPIPSTIEGEDLSRFVLQEKKEEDRDALVMSVSPFAGYYDGKVFRGVRTARYTYVRDLEGPWLLYDNQEDPYQMKNRVSDASYAGVRKVLEAQLRAKLEQTRDSFLSREEYLEQWGYTVDARGCIPYFYQHYGRGKKPERFRAQSPMKKAG